MGRADEQQIRVGSHLQQGLNAKLVTGHDSCSCTGNLPGFEGKTEGVSQTVESWGEKIRV